MTDQFGPSDPNIDRFITDSEHLVPSNWVNPELVEQEVNKPWAVVISYDHETNQYESLIPELGIGTCAATRGEALAGLEDCLVTFVKSVLETGGRIPEPPAKSIEEYLPEGQPSSTDEWLAEKRAPLTRRLTPEEAVVEMQQGAKLIDVRTLEQQKADGVIPGAIAIGLNVLEWRCHPKSPNRDPNIADDYNQRLIILCNQGFSSSVAAYHLHELGLTNTTDIDGGFEAWKASGQPWVEYKEASV